MAVLAAVPALMASAGGAASAAAIGGTILSGVGTLMAGRNAAAMGRNQQQVANYEAAQLEAMGRSEHAAASVRAEEAGKERDLLISRARAVGAASGGGQDYDLIGDIEEEGAWRVGSARWEGEEALKGRKAQAGGRRADGKMARAEGNMARSASYLQAGSTLLSQGASIKDKYG